MDEDRVIDEKYEYNCPQFVDFAMPQTIDDKADEIFDFDHEVGEPIDFETDQDVRIPENFEEPSPPQRADAPTVMSSSKNQAVNKDEHLPKDIAQVPEKHHQPAEQREISPSTDNVVSTDNDIADAPVVEEKVDETERTVAIAEAEQPLIADAEPAVEVDVKPVVVEVVPALVANEEPAVVASEPAVVANDEPAVVANDDPADVADDEPAVIANEEPADVADDEPAVVANDEIADVASEECSRVTAEEELTREREEQGKFQADKRLHEEVEEDVRMPETPAGEDIPEVSAGEHGEDIVVESEERAASNAGTTEPEESQESMEVGGRQTPIAPVHEELESNEKEAEASPRALTLSNVVTSFDKPGPVAPSNMVTSWGSDAPSDKQEGKKNANKDRRSRPTTRRTTRSLNNDSNTLKRATSMENSQRRSLRIKHRISDSPAIKRRRVSDKSQVRSRGSATKPSKTNAGPPPSKPFISKLTLPTTPVCLKRNAVKPGSQFKTTEQMEMERIADFRRQLAERKKQSQASYKKVQESSGHHAKRAVIPPTRPEAFSFETDRRIKQHPMATRQDCKSFEQNLRRSGPSSPTHVPAGNRGPTVAKPFHFADSRKRKFEGEIKNSPYVSMATRINQFQTKTPQRYHTRRSGDNHDRSLGQQEAVQKPRLTCPKTPNLESRNRKRPVSVESAADKEEKEVHEMKCYKFKAKPVNPRVMSNLNIGLKMTSHKEPTRPVGFNLESERRMKEREIKKAEEEEEARRKEEHHEFHARPMPVKMLEGPVGLAEVKSRPLTCPKSPAFALKNRVRTKDDSIAEPEEPKAHMIRANPIMHVGVPFKPQVAHKTTEIQPFSFEQRDRQTKARKEAKIQEIYQEEEKARQFKAKPILDNVALPEKKVKPVTKQEPFKLANDEKGAKRAEEWSKKIEEELQEQRAQANMFKAKPAEILYHEPFVPQKPTKPLTEISGFDLNTDRRATEREEFEQWKLKKELEERERRSEQERLLKAEEQEEIEHMRREQMVHKAQPVKHYKPIHVHPSLRPLTEAQSPNFSDRFQK